MQTVKEQVSQKIKLKKGKKTHQYIYPDLALKPATSVCLFSKIRTYALDVQNRAQKTLLFKFVFQTVSG
jgi:hypothetical protein